jgi:LPS export ABC transporter protein LptC
VLLAAMVAASSAAACTDTKSPPVVPTTPLADSADQIMYRARSVLTDRGVQRADLLADTAYFFDENTRIEMRQVNTTFFRPTGAKNAVLTARQGTYNTRLGNMEARGNVVVVSEDGRRLTTEQLRYDQQKNEISSDSAFVFTETGRRLEGVGFTSDPDMTRMRCMASCRGSYGQVRLPGEGTPPQAAPAGTFRLPGEGAPAAPTPRQPAPPAPTPAPTPAPPADTARPAPADSGTFRLPGEGPP